MDATDSDEPRVVWRRDDGMLDITESPFDPGENLVLRASSRRGGKTAHIQRNLSRYDAASMASAILAYYSSGVPGAATVEPADRQELAKTLGSLAEQVARLAREMRGEEAGVMPPSVAVTLSTGSYQGPIERALIAAGTTVNMTVPGTTTTVWVSANIQ